MTQALGLFTLLVMARLLGPEAYGQFGILQSTLATLVAPTSAALGLTATRYVAAYRAGDPDKAGRVVSLALMMSLVLGVPLSIIIWQFAPVLAPALLAAPYLAVELRWIAVAALLNLLIGTQTGILAGLEAFKSTATFNMWRGLLNLFIMLAGVHGWGVRGAVVAMVVSALVTSGLGMRVVWAEARQAGVRIQSRGALGEWRLLLGFSLPTVLASNATVIARYAANLALVRSPGGYEQLGLFNAANQWFIAVSFLPAALSQPLLPMLADLYGRHALKEFRTALQKGALVTMSNVIPISLAIIAGAHIVAGFYGSAYQGLEEVLVPLVGAASFAAVVSVVGVVLSALDRRWQALALNAAWAAIFFLTYRATWPGGARGLALAYCISYSLYFLIVMLYVVRILRFRGSTSGTRKA